MKYGFKIKIKNYKLPEGLAHNCEDPLVDERDDQVYSTEFKLAINAGWRKTSTLES